MVILDGVPGRVVVLRPNLAAGLIRFININPVLSFDTHRVLITRVGVSKSCNYQLLHSLGDIVYVYVFGDRVGQIVVHGLAIGGPVSYGVGCRFESGSGMDNALDYFDQNRVAGQQTNREVEVTIGTTPIRGFLTDMNMDILNPEFQLAEFSMVIRTIPEVLPRGGRAGNQQGGPSNVMSGPPVPGLTGSSSPPGTTSVNGEPVTVTPETGTTTPISPGASTSPSI